MKKFGSIAVIVSVMHFLEDALLVALGRYTDINYFMLLLGTIMFGLLIAGIARHPKVKSWLGD